jgi:integrase
MPKPRFARKQRAPPSIKDREFLWDDAVSGFGVAAFPSGKKVYVAQYRHGGRSRRASIGEHGRLAPDEARSEAKQLLGIVEAGSDPIAERRAAREVRTFKAVADDFLSLHAATKRKARTVAEYRRILQAHILPVIGARRIVDVRRADVARLHAGLVRTPYEANRTLAVISSVWNWAARRGEVMLADNPGKAIERYPEHGRERFLTSEEFARLGDTLRLAETTGLPWQVDETKPAAGHAPKAGHRLRTLDPFAVAAIRLLILTGARLREILDGRWEHVDLERGVIFLPDSKTGKKPIYLSAAALVVLSTLPHLEGNPHIIPGDRTGQPRADLTRPWTAVTKAARLEGLRIHDLRHSFASIGAGASMGLPIIGKLLSHSQAATTHRYAHLDADPLRRAVETIGATISAAMSGGKGQNVVAMPKGKLR